jgi:branched-chain amino acid transport system ATP-binding protein
VKVEVEDVWVRLGGVDVLRGVGLEVGGGVSAALIGRNGAGKTTLLRTIIGAVRPYRGSVLVSANGGSRVDATRLKPYQVASLGIGYVPQGRMVFPDLTVEENLEVAAGGPVPHDLIDWIYTIMPELRKLRGRLGLYLSGGEQQMVAIARALVRRPRLLLLDEPFEGLAPKVVARLMDALREVKATGVSLLITESGQLKRIRPLVDVAYGIDRGEIVYSGDPDGILKDPVARQRIWGI